MAISGIVEQVRDRPVRRLQRHADDATWSLTTNLGVLIQFHLRFRKKGNRQVMTITESAPMTAPDAPAVAEGREFVRLSPVEAAAAQQYGALLVDIRPATLRRLSGEVPGALIVSGPVRDWRVEPGDPLRVCEVGTSLEVIVLGDGSSASILAASALRGYGVHATDVIGGFPAWAAMSLPVCVGVTRSGRYVDADGLDTELLRTGNLPCGVSA
jgi:rhodanese-related sulfurtransferase